MDQNSQVQVPPLICEFLSSFEPYFSHLENGDENALEGLLVRLLSQ